MPFQQKGDLGLRANEERQIHEELSAPPLFASKQDMTLRAAPPSSPPRRTEAHHWRHLRDPCQPGGGTGESVWQTLLTVPLPLVSHPLALLQLPALATVPLLRLVTSLELSWSFAKTLPEPAL